MAPPHNTPGNIRHLFVPDGFKAMHDEGCIPVRAMPAARAGPASPGAKSAFVSASRGPSLSRLDGPARHIVIRSSLLDDWCGFVADVRASPVSHVLVALGGFLAGLLLIIVPAVLAVSL